MRSCSSDLIQCRHVQYCVPSPWDHATPSWHLIETFDLVFRTVRSWSPLLMPSRHVRSVVPNPWDPAAPIWYIVGMVDLIFPTREILQSRPHTSYAGCMQVETVVPYPWEPAAPPEYLVGMFDLMFLTREILQPRCDTSYACLNCYSLSMRSWSPILIWFAEPVRSCSPILIPCSHARPCVLSPWYHATPFWQLICTFDLVFRTRYILKSPPET